MTRTKRSVLPRSKTLVIHGKDNDERDQIDSHDPKIDPEHDRRGCGEPRKLEGGLPDGKEDNQDGSNGGTHQEAHTEDEDDPRRAWNPRASCLTEMLDGHLSQHEAHRNQDEERPPFIEGNIDTGCTRIR